MISPPSAQCWKTTPIFPERANISLAHVTAPDALTLEGLGARRRFDARLRFGCLRRRRLGSPDQAHRPQGTRDASRRRSRHRLDRREPHPDDRRHGIRARRSVAARRLRDSGCIRCSLPGDISMEHGTPSNTALVAAAIRVAHQTFDDGRVFRDPFAEDMLGPEGAGVDDGPAYRARLSNDAVPARRPQPLRWRCSGRGSGKRLSSSRGARRRPRYPWPPQPPSRSGPPRLRGRPPGDPGPTNVGGYCASGRSCRPVSPWYRRYSAKMTLRQPWQQRVGRPTNRPFSNCSASSYICPRKLGRRFSALSPASPRPKSSSTIRHHRRIKPQAGARSPKR